MTLEKCKEPSREPCIPAAEIKENGMKGMSKKISSIPKFFLSHQNKLTY